VRVRYRSLFTQPRRSMTLVDKTVTEKAYTSYTIVTTNHIMK